MQNLTVLLLACLLLPPVGLVLLWLRRGTPFSRKILGTLAIGLLTLGHLFLYGMRVQMDGSGMRPIFYFPNTEARYAALDQREPKAVAADGTLAVQPGTAPAAAKSEPGAAGVAAAETSAAAADSPASAAAGRQWTAFRGPERDGRYREPITLNLDWASSLKPVWKQPIGGGYASFAVVNGKAFTIEQRRDREVVTAYDVATGRELWAYSWAANFQESMGGDGPRSTPTWDGGRLYALGATGELHVLDAESGRRIWSRNILTDNQAQNLTWGMSASPLIVDDKVIVLPGGSPGKSVVAYNKLTGEPVWKSLDDKQAYTSPIAVALAGQRQLVVVSARRIMGLTIEEGKLLWEHPWVTEYDVNSAQPLVVDDRRIFLSSGYGHGALVLEVTRSGSGFSVRPLWENINMKNKFSSSVLKDGHIYGLDEAILACVDVSTGERKWKGGRYGYGQLVLAGDRLIVLTETGDLALVKASPTAFEEQARFPAIEGKTWNHPAIGGGYLLVRNSSEMAAFRLAR